MTSSVQRKRDRKKNLTYMLFLLPGLVYLVINNYIPMMGVFIAFKNIDYVKGIFKSDWIGLENFRFLFRIRQGYSFFKCLAKNCQYALKY